MVAESALHPDPVRGHDAVLRLQRRGGRTTPCSRSSRSGTAANLVGSWIAYAIGYYGRIDILEKHGKKLHIKPSHLAWADRWFERYGAWTVFFTRMLPIIRTFISLPAGVARMPFWRFTVLTVAGCIPWVFMLAFTGKQVGDNWENWKDSLHYVDYAVAVLIVIGDHLLRACGTAAGRVRPASRPPMRRAEVVALGLVQGAGRAAADLLVGPRRALPLLLGWEHADLDGARRKEVEVALHAGGAVGLVIGAAARADGAAAGRRAALDDRRRWRSRSSLERAIEERLGGPGARWRAACWPARWRWCWPTGGRERGCEPRTRGRSTACCSGSRRRARWCRGCRARARRWPRRGRSGSRGRTPSRLSRGVGGAGDRGRRGAEGAAAPAAAAGALGAGDAGGRRRGGGGRHARRDAARARARARPPAAAVGRLPLRARRRRPAVRENRGR